MFGIGKLPADLRDQLEAEGLIYLEEYVAVTRRFTGAIPGLRASHSIASYPGALAFTEQRVLGTLSSLPKLAGRAVDVRWDAPQTGAATAEISSTGLQLISTSPRWTRGSTASYRCTSKRTSARTCWLAYRCGHLPLTCRPNTCSARSELPIVPDPCSP
ncbi:hypothetical protein NIIDMKKI_70230 [Mycobacterium kansasii]|uniref:Uncharacterized protein n=1 Tax=Mycobacterium kansasii TaxID=1768 RepID=A0A7G1ILY0_MYCKA|nr:hypothetical protein NIIDMKKI_70230 [Mycobacterium kansasii]